MKREALVSISFDVFASISRAAPLQIYPTTYQEEGLRFLAAFKAFRRSNRCRILLNILSNS
jgi:hypothetical protein